MNYYEIYLSDREKKELEETINAIKTDSEYREYLMQFLDEPFRYTKIEKLAIEAANISHQGTEVVNNDLSNQYDSYNEINIETDEDLRITCMNMAIGSLILKLLANQSNHKKFSEYDIEGIAKRQKGGLISTKDKPMIIKFIIDYNRNHPRYFSNNAEKYYMQYQKLEKTDENIEWFKKLAGGYNTNIYLYELNMSDEKSDIFQNSAVNNQTSNKKSSSIKILERLRSYFETKNEKIEEESEEELNEIIDMYLKQIELGEENNQQSIENIQKRKI